MKRGLATGSLGLALLLVAALLGSVALFAFALGLLVLVLGCLMATAVGAGRVVVERTVDRDEVVEGQPITLRFRVRAPRALPVHAEILDADGIWRRLERDSSRRCTIERPGAHLIGPSAVRVRDDLRLFASSRRPTAGDPAFVLVLPTPASVGLEQRPQGADPGGDPEPDGLQPYSRGTPFGRIHWPSVARAGEWQERRVITAPRGMPLVVVDLSGSPSDEAVGWTLRVAAGQIHGLAGAGGCRVLLPGERHPIPVESVSGGWAGMHRRLASLRSAVGTAPPTAPPGAIHVRAAQAPTRGPARSGRLPSEVVPLEKATFGSGAGRR
ncbi:MAG TPA: DUF58 domain-containing protein [Solirubrobacterales bacterium]|nr:DUF58 domain-containing protein [Solirubrobacterales bacterium]